MKKITTLLILAMAGINFSFAQTPALFGTCYSGGASGWGTIFQSDLNGNNLNTVYSFLNPEGAMPWGKIAQAPNGKIYGVTFLGGCSDSCTLYEYDPIAHTCIDVYDFYCNTPIGEPSQGGLIILPDGYIYGLQQTGVIYKFDPNTHVYTLLSQASGYYMGGLMQAADGALYGASYSGGIYSHGFIFRYDLSTQIYSVLYSFDGPHGATPYYGSLIQGTNGKLYGTTYTGGANNKGVIFSYDLSSSILTNLYDFTADNGGSPYSGLVQAANGKLYGMTYLGGISNFGVIYSYDISASQYSELYDFDGTNGSNPMGSLTQASNGKLFGTTYNGGVNNLGAAFSYDIASGTYTKLTDFTIASGTHPQSNFQEVTIEPEGITSAGTSLVSIYIDPSTQQLTIQAPDVKANSQLVMVDALGKKVLQAEINNQKSQFDLSSFPRGIYVVQLTSDKEAVTRKVILSK